MSNSGWTFSIFFRFEIVFWSATLKNDGATSVSHLGSIAVTSRMYSRLHKTGQHSQHPEKILNTQTNCNNSRSQDKLVVDTPLGRAVEKGGRRVQKDGSSARNRSQHMHILAHRSAAHPSTRVL